jgi:hypothetical protein
VASGKILCYVPDVWVPEATGLIKENMAVLWANDGERSYPGLGFERGRVEHPVRNENTNMIGFSPGNEKLILWPGYVRVMRI